MQEELYDMYKMLQYLPVTKPMILLDRTIVSHYFTERLRNDDVDFQSLLQYSTDNLGIQEIRETIIPEIIFVFDCTLQTLENRFRKEDRETIDGKFKRENVQQRYPLFQEVIHNIPDLIKDKVYIINGNNNRQTVHGTITSILKERYPEYFQK
ncbi:MAG: hypothetical protein WCG98_06000 [bacterium]